MVIVLPQRQSMSVGETRLVKVNMTDLMESGDTLSGTPTVVEITTTDLTLANKALNTSTYTDDNDPATTVAANCAVQFTVTNGVTANSPYTISVTVATVGGQTLKRYLELYFA